MRDKCEEIEYMENNHETFNMYGKVREVVGTYNKIATNTVVDPNGKILIDEKKILETGYKYIKEIVDDHKPNESNY